MERRFVMSFEEVLATLARFSDADMAAPWQWPGHSGGALQVRDAHWQCIEREQAALVAAPPSAREAAAIMDLAQAAWGDLRGLICGLDDAILDADPGGGKWTVRALLAHVLLVERRYHRQVEYAVARDDSDPVYLDRPLELAPEDQAGGIGEWLARIEASRAASDAFCTSLDPSVFVRPTRWAGYDVDIRFRLHRFGPHLAEHTIHAEKLLRALGQPPAEARQVVRRLSALRGAHERRTPPEELAAIDRQHAALAGSLRLSA